MLRIFLNLCFWFYLSASLVLFAFEIYVYRINAGRAADDPQKQVYHPLAVLLFPFWPLWALAWLTLFLLRALLYGMFLVLFTIALVVIRKPFILVWLEKAATAAGGRLLKVNTMLLRLLLPQAAYQKT
jgi:hypothetical protein